MLEICHRLGIHHANAYYVLVIAPKALYRRLRQSLKIGTKYVYSQARLTERVI